jgi:hypothetical protein
MCLQKLKWALGLKTSQKCTSTNAGMGKRGALGMGNMDTHMGPEGENVEFNHVFHVVNKIVRHKNLSQIL